MCLGMSPVLNTPFFLEQEISNKKKNYKNKLKQRAQFKITNRRRGINLIYKNSRKILQNLKQG